MNTTNLILSLIMLFSLIACGSGGPQKLPDTDIENDIQIEPEPQKDSPIISYFGRIDSSTPSEPVFIWQGTSIETQFSGEFLEVGFSQLKGQVYFDVEIDGHASVLTAKDGWTSVPVPSGPSTHSIRLFKRSEADVGYVTFLGFRTKPDGGEQSTPLFNPPSQKVSNTKKYLFFGDSITAGACNEDGNEDQWEDYSTHNNALSYGAITAEAMDAEYRNISVSGMGITMGYNKLLFKEVWDRIYPDPTSDQADFNLWQPDVIFTNFGENDDSFSSSENKSFPSNFTSEYVDVVKKIRSAYPSSTIVILRGGMYGGAQSERLRGPWNEVVKNLQSQDANIKSFVFNHWSSKHPRVSDHKMMADELTNWIQSNL